MIKEFVEPETKEKIVILYNKLIENNFTIQYLQDSLVMMGKVILRIIPRSEQEKLYVTSSLGILIDDILEMDSISEEEKKKAILELVAVDKDELCSLIKKIITKVESDKGEAVDNGYCSLLWEP
jgi:hypothetical protein